MSLIKKFIDLCQNNPEQIKINVVGDSIVDEYFRLTSNRMSPEFYIPVFLTENEKPTESRPGGVAKVSEQFKNFNFIVSLFCFMDKNSWNVFPWARHGTDYVKNRVEHVPVKKRIYNVDEPLFRWDIEKDNYGSTNKSLKRIRKSLFNEFKSIPAEVTILSDYNKGFFTEKTIPQWIENSKISIVDPKKGPAKKWAGCTIFKPNQKEAEEMSGEKNWKQQSDYFMKELNCKAVIITREGRGVVGKTSNGYFEYKPKYTIEPVSCVGAGDAFISFVSMAIAQGLTILEAVEIAFKAGSIYVQKKYNEPLHPDELLSYE